MNDGAPAESDRLDGFPHPRETTVLFGHQAAERAMLEAWSTGRLHHAWLLGGPEGIGKATLAWRFARFLLAEPEAGADSLAVAADHLAARRVAAGGVGDVAVLRRVPNEKTGRLYSEIRVDDVRRAATLFQGSARTGGFRICIIDPVEELNRAGANALLKLIEEPPARSLFLLIAHRPGRVMPTLRSRCRALSLAPLTTDRVTEALRPLGYPNDDVSAQAVAEAVRRAGGSVRHALHWLGGERLALDGEVSALLGRLPEVDWRGLHALADRIGNDEETFDLAVAAVLDFLHGRAGRLAAQGEAPLRRLAPLAEVWDKVRRSAWDTTSLNLDRRATLLSIFADLAQATRPF